MAIITKSEKEVDYKISYYGDGVGIFERHGKKRLLFLAHRDGSYEPGPGLGTDTISLVDAIPTTLVLDVLGEAKDFYNKGK